MKKSNFTVRSCKGLTESVFEMILEGDSSPISRPGQFVEVAVPGFFLRRPISVADWGDGWLKLLIKEAGRATAFLKGVEPGTGLDLLAGLGNGFSLDEDACGEVVVAGGGIGIAPLYGLAKRLVPKCPSLIAVLAFRSASDAFYVEEFRSLGCRVEVYSDDGTIGTKGYASCALESMRRPCRLYACGPEAMLRSLCASRCVTGGQFSLEARMGCGFGACVGCTIETPSGPKRVCREGPVFGMEDLPWNR